MAKKQKKIEVKTVSCGLYAKWSNRCGELPKFLKFTNEIPARYESEFGYTLSIKNGKGKTVDYTVYHPDFSDNNPESKLPFTGKIPIKPGSFEVYLGDTLWEPMTDMIGTWRFVAKIDGKIVEDKSFEIIENIELHKELIDKNKNQHL